LKYIGQKLKTQLLGKKKPPEGGFLYFRND
jgi:hypothetical protein